MKRYVLAGIAVAVTLFSGGCVDPNLPKCYENDGDKKVEIAQWACYPYQYNDGHDVQYDPQLIRMNRENIPVSEKYTILEREGYKFRVSLMLKRFYENIAATHAVDMASFKAFTKGLKVLEYGKGRFGGATISHKFEYALIYMFDSGYKEKVSEGIKGATEAYIKHYKLKDDVAKTLRDAVAKTVKFYYTTKTYPANFKL